MNDFTVITPTGDRPESLSICYELMKKQTLKPKEWIIIDDGLTAIPFHKHSVFNFSFVKYIRRERMANEPNHTLPVQMIKALEFVSTDKIVIMEDDDWYIDNHLEKMNGYLEDFDLVGHQWNMYYFLPERTYFQHQNEKWSSFCSTAFHRRIFQMIISMDKNNPYIDLRLFKKAPPNIKKFLFRPNKINVLGIKGLPGRVGATYSSNRDILKAGLKNDNNLSFLESIVGEDIKYYKPYCGVIK